MGGEGGGMKVGGLEAWAGGRGGMVVEGGRGVFRYE